MRLIVFIIIVSFCSCITRERCQERFLAKESETTITKDSVVLVHDTIQIKGETIIINDEIPCPDFKLNKTIKKNNVTLSVKIDHGKMELNCKTDSLKKVIDGLKHIITTTSNKVEVHEILKWQVKWYYKACMWITGIFGLIIAGYVIRLIQMPRK